MVMALALVFAAPRAAADGALRLDDAVALARSRNERARIADAQVVVAEAGVAKARAGFLPVLTLGATDTQRPESVVKNGMVVQPSNVAAANASLSQPIVNLPAWPLYRQAREALEAQRDSSTEDRRTLTFDAARAFLAVLTAQGVLEAAERRLGTASANVSDAQARVDAQLTSTNDVTRAQVDRAGAQREVEADRGARDAALVQLDFILFSPVRSGVARPEATLTEARRKVANVDELSGFGVSHRPDLAAARHAALAAHDFALEPLLRFSPTLALTGQASASTNPSPTTGNVWDASAALTLNWILYDAGVRNADRDARAAQALIADLTREQLERAVDEEVRAGAALLASAQAALAAAEDAVRAARQSADETAILYRQGLAKAIELVDANDERFVAEVSFANAEYSTAQAYLNLRQAVGLDPLGAKLP
jgi:outer membrane protein TolC